VVHPDCATGDGVAVGGTGVGVDVGDGVAEGTGVSVGTGEGMLVGTGVRVIAGRAVGEAVGRSTAVGSAGPHPAIRAIKLVQAITARIAFITHPVCSVPQVAGPVRHVRRSAAIEWSPCAWLGSCRRAG
jgi:hypothetical protein